jgi:hypothetical protein
MIKGPLRHKCSKVHHCTTTSRNDCTTLASHRTADTSANPIKFTASAVLRLEAQSSVPKPSALVLPSAKTRAMTYTGRLMYHNRNLNYVKHMKIPRHRKSERRPQCKPTARQLLGYLASRFSSSVVENKSWGICQTSVCNFMSAEHYPSKLDVLIIS